VYDASYARIDRCIRELVAVLDGAQGKFVYVAEKDKDGKDVAGVRPVTLGEWVVQDGANLWIVESGLKPGDRAAGQGAILFKPYIIQALQTRSAPGGRS